MSKESNIIGREYLTFDGINMTFNEDSDCKELSDNKTCGFTSSDRSILGIGSLVQDRTFMDTIKTYPINVEVVTLRTYNITSGKLPAAATGSVTVKLNTSMVMLPKEPMRPRLADERIGFFQNPVIEFSDEQ